MKQPTIRLSEARPPWLDSTNRVSGKPGAVHPDRRQPGGTSDTAGSRKPGEEEGTARTGRDDRFRAYLVKMGFRAAPDGVRYRGQSGCFRPGDEPFHWTHESGDQNTPIWIAERTLEQGIDLPSEVWTLGPVRGAVLCVPTPDGYAEHPFRQIALEVQNGTYQLLVPRYRLKLGR